MQYELGLNYLGNTDDEHRKVIQKLRNVKRKLNTGVLQYLLKEEASFY